MDHAKQIILTSNLWNASLYLVRKINSRYLNCGHWFGVSSVAIFFTYTICKVKLAWLSGSQADLEAIPLKVWLTEGVP